MREPHHPARAELELSSVLHALSDPARLEIVRRLADGDEPSCGTFDLGLSKATLSHHFKVLRESGVVRTRPEGRKRLLSLRTRRPGVPLPRTAGRGPGGEAAPDEVSGLKLRPAGMGRPGLEPRTNGLTCRTGSHRPPALAGVAVWTISSPSTRR